ncbi:MAG: VanZ family protein [Armatimonadota bacterium]
MKNKKILFWIPAVACMAAIFVLSSMPSLPQPPGIFGFDKFEHYLAYAVLSILVFIASRKTWPSSKLSRIMALSVVITTFYGMTDEFHQRFVPNRCCDVFDLMADMTGAISGAVLAFITVKIFTSRKGKCDSYGKRAEK